MAICSKSLLKITIAILLSATTVWGQNQSKSFIAGKLLLDDSWSSTIYLSHIPTFDDLYVMSSELIIARTSIDSLGYFNFNIDYFPVEENLFRLHLVKKDDTPATLIIGGKDENHLFLLADRSSTIYINSSSSSPPFKNVIIEKSKQNLVFQKITQHLNYTDSLASESSASKRSLIEKQLEKDLFVIADTTKYFMVSLYAIYKNKFLENYTSYESFYQSYITKWENQNNLYFDSFKKKLNVTTPNNYNIVIAIFSITILTFIGFVVGRYSFKTSKSKTFNIDKLSVQERKIYEMLQRGASNQEIADEFNIGLSTVKSHISSIYSKLNVKSRKEIATMVSSTNIGPLER